MPLKTLFQKLVTFCVYHQFKINWFLSSQISVVVCCLWQCVFSLCTLIMLMALHNMWFKDSGSLTGAGFSGSGEPMDGLCGNPQSRQQPQGTASLWQGQWVFFSLVQFVKHDLNPSLNHDLETKKGGFRTGIYQLCPTASCNSYHHCVNFWSESCIIMDSSIMWHQPCQRFKYTTSMDIQKRAIKSCSLM